MQTTHIYFDFVRETDNYIIDHYSFSNNIKYSKSPVMLQYFKEIPAPNNVIEFLLVKFWVSIRDMVIDNILFNASSTNTRLECPAGLKEIAL